jgi:DNA mismatch repair protein MutS
VRSYTLFATHYFEITRLAEERVGVDIVHLEAVEHGERIVFLHSVEPGPASQSYGLQVAALAGVPAGVLAVARRQLERLEQQAPETPQLSLFAPRAAAQDSVPEREPYALAERLSQIDPDDLTPRQALDLIYELHALRGD